MDIGQIPDLTGVNQANIPPPPPVNRLCAGQSENYILDMNLAAKLGFSVADTEATAKHQVLVHGTIRYADVRGKNGHVFRYGWALRAVIVATGEGLDADLTLPALAASVQFSRAQASCNLQVHGYNGNYDMPSWNSFDVESYSQYQTQVAALEKQIEEDDQNVSPELLQVSVSNVLPGEAGSVAVVYALSAIAHKRSLESALEEYPGDQATARNIISQVYDARIGTGTRGHPDETAAKAAHNAIYGMTLVKHVWA